jgi:hypothetical protein
MNIWSNKLISNILLFENKLKSWLFLSHTTLLIYTS